MFTGPEMTVPGYASCLTQAIGLSERLLPIKFSRLQEVSPATLCDQMPGPSLSHFGGTHAFPSHSHNYDIIQVWSSAFVLKNQNFYGGEFLGTEDKQGGGAGPKGLLHLLGSM